MTTTTIVAFLARKHGLNVLQTLLNTPQHRILCLFTHKLKPKSEDPNRPERDDFSSFAELAKKHNIPLYTIDTSKEADQIPSILEKLSFDYIVSVSWRRKIPGNILQMAKKGCINLHRGLLPNYPGAEPIKQALLHQDQTIAITAHEMVEEIDAGQILATYVHQVNYDQEQSLEKNVDRLKEEITPHFGPLLLKAFDIISFKADDSGMLESDEFPIKYILIDFDGTLVDSMPILLNVYQSFLSKHKQKGDTAEFETLIGMTIKEIVETLKNTYQLGESVEALQNEYMGMVKVALEDGVSLFPHAKETLQFLKHQKLILAVVSSAPEAFVREILEDNGIDKLFKEIIGPKEGDRGKPHPDLYQRALSMLHIQPFQALVIEDAVAGAQAALAAKIPTIFMNFGDESRGADELDFENDPVGLIGVADWIEVKDIVKELILFSEIDLSE